MIFTRSISW